MFDFGVISSEVTSGLLYARPGYASLSAAAHAWLQLAAELDTTARLYRSVLQTLSGVWRRALGSSDAGHHDPYVLWPQTTAVRAN